MQWVIDYQAALWCETRQGLELPNRCNGHRIERPTVFAPDSKLCFWVTAPDEIRDNGPAFAIELYIHDPTFDVRKEKPFQAIARLEIIVSNHRVVGRLGTYPEC